MCQVMRESQAATPEVWWADRRALSLVLQGVAVLLVLFVAGCSATQPDKQQRPSGDLTSPIVSEVPTEPSGGQASASTTGTGEVVTLGTFGALQVAGQAGLKSGELVVHRVSRALGSPTSREEGRLCPGFSAPGSRVAWGGLTVFIPSAIVTLGDDRYLPETAAGYTYQRMGSGDAELATERGITVGSTAAQVRSAYPEGEEELVGEVTMFRVAAARFVFEIDGATSDSSVVAIHSGLSCVSAS